MTNELIKQAYVISKAAKGVKRYHTLQKEAMQKQAIDGASTWDTAKQIAGDYAMPTLVPAGIAGILGAIINGAQGKSMLKGLLGYGAAGALGGAGYKAYNDFAKANKQDKQDNPAISSEDTSETETEEPNWV